MARRTPAIAAALAVSAALLLTACGGSNNDASKDKIKGADEGTKSPSASASTSAAPGAARPEITIPHSFQLNFQGWNSSDPNEQAVLNDGKEQVRAGYAAIMANAPDAEYLKFYDTAAGLSQDQEWIKTYTDKNLTLIGKAPVYDAKASMLGSNKTRAILNYCMDETKAYTKGRKTGKVEGNPAGTDPKVYYTSTLQKSSQGVWQTVSTNSKRGGCPS
ncbi:hypothetical protein OHB13_21575 [Streptomyces sp. NBC_00440]|uniref:hypothetical protein n=1 Tax=unclassified Streptomyces TaxID=2593676 RepID=UPI002E1A8896|nr:hypothetical protein OG221_15865 [Streptomyces sp. NBC_00932]